MASDAQADQALNRTQTSVKDAAWATAVVVVWSVCVLALAGLILLRRPGGAPLAPSLIAALLVAGIGLLVGWGLYRCRRWARTAAIGIASLAWLYVSMQITLSTLAGVLSGQHVPPLHQVIQDVGIGVLRVLAIGAIPLGLVVGLKRAEVLFAETAHQREVVDAAVWRFLMMAALMAIIVVVLIVVFTGREAWQSIAEVGIGRMISGRVWRPGSAGEQGAQFGMLPMVVGSILSTFGAMAIALPLSLGAAILLTQVAPPWVRQACQPAIELLAGIPSVVYGLFGMVVLAPIIRRIDIPGNSGYGLLNASVILAIMVLPTITNVARDAITAVPKTYAEASLALGATPWQTIRHVVLPAAGPGIMAAVVLGIGRALGETMALIMVVGNSIGMPEPLNSSPLTLFLSTARTLTGNIAVEINYATGTHRSALFFSGVLLFAMVVLTNRLAGRLIRKGAGL